MNDEHLDRDGAMYEVDGTTLALVEQQRATIMDELRSSRAVSLTLLCTDGDARHWGLYMHKDEDPQSFLVYAAVRATRDAAAALGFDHERTCALILASIEEGVGE